MISSTLPAFTASGFMIITVTSFLVGTVGKVSHLDHRGETCDNYWRDLIPISGSGSGSGGMSSSSTGSSAFKPSSTIYITQEYVILYLCE